MTLTIRNAEERDTPLIFSFIRELAAARTVRGSNLQLLFL